MTHALASRSVVASTIQRTSLYFMASLCVLLIPPGCFGQGTVDTSSWTNVSGWHGILTISGHGSGTYSTSCGGTEKYTNDQELAGSPSLRGGFSTWIGEIFPQTVSLRITDEQTCPAPFPSDCFQSDTATGNDILENVILNISSDGTYAISRGTVPITHIGCNGENEKLGYFFGPTISPSGDFTLTGNQPLPPTGVTLKGSINGYRDSQFHLAALWNINWRLAPVCKLDTSKITPRRQAGGTWGAKTYDHSSDQMGDRGCATTALEMALEYAGVTRTPGNNGVPLDPGSLNTFMNETDTDYSGQSANWDPTVRDVSQGKLKYSAASDGVLSTVDNPEAAKDAVDVALCGANPHPVIVAVTSTDGSRFPGHFVLIVGKDGDVYDILDPAGLGSTLDTYGNKFQTRGSVVPTIDPPDQSIGALDISVDNNATLLVTDGNKNQTGEVESTGKTLQNIPNSSYIVDTIVGDITHEVPSQSGHSVEIFAPADGKYTIAVNGTASGTYHLSIRAFSRDASPEPDIVLSGTSAPGSVTTYEVSYASAVGGVTTATKTQIAKADLNEDGVIDCADLAIVKASFGKKFGQIGFDPRADINGDGVVNIFDLSIVAKQLPAGKTCP